MIVMQPNFGLILMIKRYWHLFKTVWVQALPAVYFFGHPGKRLKIYGITGTDGKTTSATLLYHVLKKSGYKVALISTVAAYIGDQEIETGFHVTSPQPWDLHKLLKRCLDADIEHVVLETTSHGLFQYRIWGIEFEMVGITNITNEHLDYFGTWEKLVKAKSLIFKQAKLAFLNADDRSFTFLKQYCQKTNVPYQTYSQDIPSNVLGKTIKARFPEVYNRWNANLIVAMARQIGINDGKLCQAINNFPGVKGRMEPIKNQLGINIVVDFAHTPNALEKALTALKGATKGKLIAVFGSAGLRDRQKRPAMGEIGSQMADLAIFTAEDPRTENIQVILRQMKEGVKETNFRKVVTQPDRKDAIKLALSLAKPNDTVGVFGKGHEKSMCFGKKEVPWSDQQVIADLLLDQNA